jgi:murein DD-endopeptidase MepM/ murein hydrolase activator NlpD
MKSQRARKQLTLMIIPEAHRNIIRFKLPNFSLYALPAAVLLVLIGSGLTVYGMHAAHQRSTAILQELHYDQKKMLEESVSEKTAELEKLHGELIELSEQTEQFKTRLKEVERLKTSIQDLTHTPTSSSKPAASSSVQAKGGVPKPVSNEQAEMLAETAKSDLAAINHEIDDLIDQLSDSRQKLIEADRLRRSTPSIWPVSSRVITSGFGLRKDPFTDLPAFHSGLDIAGRLNDPVYATADGVVRIAAWDNSYGNQVRIDHGNGIETDYYHLNKINVEQGQKVVKGQKIGQVGSTGRSTGTHLHYEVRINNVEVDPVPYLKSK